MINQNENVPFGCYYIQRDYIEYLQEHGDSHVPNADYEDNNRAIKFYCGPVLTINRVNYYAPVSHEVESKDDMIACNNKTGREVQYGVFLSGKRDRTGNLDFRHMIPCQDNELLTPCENLSPFGKTQERSCLAQKDKIQECARNVYDAVHFDLIPFLTRTCIDFEKVYDAACEYDDIKDEFANVPMTNLAQRFAKIDTSHVSEQNIVKTTDRQPGED